MRLAIATLTALLFALTFYPSTPADAAIQKTRLQPYQSQTAAQQQEDDDPCETDTLAKAATPLTAERHTSLRRLYDRMQRGAPFSLEERSVLERFHDGRFVSDVEADVVIARLLYDVFVLHRSVPPRHEALYASYRAHIAKQDREVADLKDPAPISRATAETEPNDTLGRANAAPNNYFVGKLSHADDADLFTVEVAAAGQLTLAFDGDPLRTSHAVTARIELQDERGTTVAELEGTARTLVTSLPSAGVYYARVSPIEGAALDPGASYSLLLTAACASDTLDESDPRFRRMHPFSQGEPCTQGPMRPHEAYEFQVGGPGPVVASLCAAGGGAADFDSFLIIYQAPGGARLSPFMPGACENALAANNDVCGEQSEVSASVEAGYFYVVVTGRCGESTGSFSLNVTKDGESLPCTKVTSGGGPTEPNFSATMTASPDPVITGDQVTYQVVLTNIGHRPRQEVVLRDTLPAETSLLSCHATAGTMTLDGNDVTVAIERMDANTSVTVTMVATASCALPDRARIVNTATITSKGGGGGGHEERAEEEELTVSATVVASNPAPVIHNLENVVVTASALDGCALGSTVEFAMPEAKDNCDGVAIEVTPKPGSFFPEGTTKVVCVATDSGGATTTEVFTVTVRSPFGACCVDDASGDVFSQVVDPESPLYGLWRYRVAATGQTFCGYSEFMRYSPRRALIAYDRDEPDCTMTANISYTTHTAVVKVTDRLTGARYILRDRNTADNPPCS